MSVAKTILNEWLDRVDQRLLATGYRATSVRVERVRDDLRARRAPFVDPHRSPKATPHALVDIDRTARELVEEAADRASHRSAIAGLVGAASLPTEVLAATIAALRLGQRLCVVYGLDPDTDRGHMALCQALAEAFEVELPVTGPADLKVTDLPALVKTLEAPPSGTARLTRGMARFTLAWAARTRRRWLPVVGVRPQATLARERTLQAGRRMTRVLRRLSEVPGSTRDRFEDAQEITDS